MAHEQASANVGQVIWGQIPVGVKMALGARDPIGIDGGLAFAVTLESRRRVRVTVMLTPGDEYDVTLSKVQPKTYAFATVAKADGIQAEALGRVLLDLARDADQIANGQ